MLTFLAEPRISKQAFMNALGEGFDDTLFDIIRSYGIDPAVALACGEHEGGLVGRAKILCNWGVLSRPHKSTRAARIVGTRIGPRVQYTSWAEGVHDWCEVIRDLYVTRLQLNDVAKALIRIATHSPSQYYSYVAMRLEQLQEFDHGVGDIT